jgi:hypothetical protein
MLLTLDTSLLWDQIALSECAGLGRSFGRELNSVGTCRGYRWL